MSRCNYCDEAERMNGDGDKVKYGSSRPLARWCFGRAYDRMHHHVKMPRQPCARAAHAPNQSAFTCFYCVLYILN